MIRRLFPCGLALAVVMSSPVMAGPGAHGPNGEHLDAPTTSGTYLSLARLPDGSVNIPKLAQRRMGLRTALAPEVEAAVSVQLPARVIADPNASGQIQSAHGGRIEPGANGLPVAGQTVRKGDVLAWVRHHAEPYAQASQEAQRAELRASLELAKKRLQRLDSLEGSVPRKDIEAARIEVEALSLKEHSVSTSLQAREALRAPISGVIARSALKAGQIVESREVLIEVIDPARLMVEANTPDVGLGSRIRDASLIGIDGVTLKLVGAARSLRDGVLPLTFRVGSATGATPLAEGQTVTLVAALRELRKGIVLPAEAVVRGPSNETVVWIKTSAERYLPQAVQVQPLDQRQILVTQGLAPDNRVVIQGAALVAQIR